MSKQEIFKLVRNDYEVVVSEFKEVTATDVHVVYEVRWTDFIANDWTETFYTLSHAIARVSALVKCEESKWHKGFVQQNVGFVKEADVFFSNVVQ